MINFLRFVDKTATVIQFYRQVVLCFILTCINYDHNSIKADIEHETTY